MTNKLFLFTKRLLAVLCISILLGAACLSWCAAAGQEKAAEANNFTGGKPWMDSSIPGNVTADTATSPADDFYLYENKAWIISHELPEGSPVTMKDLGAGERAQVRDALAGDVLSGHDAHQGPITL